MSKTCNTHRRQFSPHSDVTIDNQIESSSAVATPKDDLKTVKSQLRKVTRKMLRLFGVARDSEEDKNVFAPPPYVDYPSYVDIQPPPTRTQMSAARAATPVRQNHVPDSLKITSREGLQPYEPHTREADLEAVIPSSRTPPMKDDNICRITGDPRCCEGFCAACGCLCCCCGVPMSLFALAIYCICSH